MEIAGIPVVQGSAVTVLATVVLAVFVAVIRGDLIPAKQRDREVDFWRGYAEGANDQAARWEAAHGKQSDRNERLTAAVEALADRELSSARAVETLQQVAERRKDSTQ